MRSSPASRQDGSYLAELPIAKCYQLHRLVRRASSLNTSRLDTQSHVTVSSEMLGPRHRR